MKTQTRDLININPRFPGAPCPQELCKNVITELNMKDFVVCYGMTETSPVTFQGFCSDDMSLKTSTVGFPSNHQEMAVMDGEGRIVEAGVEGELVTRGYSTMLGYWGDEEKTREVITPDRWFHTGDTAVIQENGYGRIVGRMKDMIIRGGENIYPREIEEFLHTHPAIGEAQVMRRRQFSLFLTRFMLNPEICSRHSACLMRGWARNFVRG